MQKFRIRKIVIILAVLVAVSLVPFMEGQLLSSGNSTEKETKHRDEFYEIGQTLMAKHNYPSRPYDSRVVVEGVGWKDGNFRLYSMLSA
ncbi:hypothetical protein A8F94_19470 [Bacillus sp. FJAT-27225]|uniref:hypothetical protein n=1 Tax=Bacillus sp. FJAT-27225 TaxID=1743144 RepID=UPI00080C2972|nr:hypothetical protein [Bacillus sp. FJAT-27225]OCA83281.1 hypothetical protein A8F94_19470 [Bacillus sp. FJAT-27225]